MANYLLLETGDKIYIEDESGFLLLEAEETALAARITKAAARNWTDGVSRTATDKVIDRNYNNKTLGG